MLNMISPTDRQVDFNIVLGQKNLQRLEYKYHLQHMCHLIGLYKIRISRDDGLLRIIKMKTI